MSKNTRQSQVEIPIEQAFALSAMVHRELGGYFKSTDISNSPMGVSNKTLLHRYITEQKRPTPEDQTRGQELLAFCRGLLMKKLSNNISQYDDVLLEIANRATITDADNYHLALMASVPQTLRRTQQRRQQDLAIEDHAESYLANIGAKVQTQITVVRSSFSANYGVYFITAKTPDNHVVFFAHKNNLTAGQYEIKGTVKAYRDNFQTQLNRVKVL